MNNICYTYYEELSSASNHREYLEKSIIDLCRRSWEQKGWRFIVLDSSFSKKHPFYQEYHDTIIQLPSVNPLGYDYHCYMRWLAMSSVGGGLMIDYDVVNINHYPDTITTKEDTKIAILQKHVPCAVIGSSENYLKVCHRFYKLLNNKQCIYQYNNQDHTSDMIMIASAFTPEDYQPIDYVKDYPKTANLIHCSQAACTKHNTNKLQAMMKYVQ